LTKPYASGPATAVAEPPGEPAASPEPDAPAPTRRFTDAVAPCATRLGRLQIRGILTGSDSVELSGTFDGPINVEGLCRVNAGGHVTGDLTAGDAVIAGDIQGRLTVIGRLELGAHARVISDIEAGTIAIAEGCFIEGRIHMRGSEGGSQPVSFREKRRGKRRKGHTPAKRASSAEAAVANPPVAPVAAASPSEPVTVLESSSPPAVEAPSSAVVEAHRTDEPSAT
jgi:cytoskeletal protein CcmA (bactofilin family)